MEYEDLAEKYGPEPKDLAGFQLLCNGLATYGDVWVGAGGGIQWVFGAVGSKTDDEGRCSLGGRIYRRSDPPCAEGVTAPAGPHHSTVGCGPLKDSGERRDFGTGSVRDMATGKGCPSLLPFRAIGLLSLQMERGKAKYGARNWELGQPLSSYFESAFRHLTKHWHGWTDEDHLAAYLWNAACYAETAERIRLGILPASLDDRPQIGRATDAEMAAKPAL